MITKIKYEPLATILTTCDNIEKCEPGIIFQPQKKNQKCGTLSGQITRICDIGLNCVTSNQSKPGICKPIDNSCTNCSKYRLCNDRDDSNCVSGFQECRPFPHSNYQMCKALFKP